jgi:hypothetical protein
MHCLILAPDAPNMLERRLALRQLHVDYWLGQGDAVKVAGAMLSDDGPEGAAGRAEDVLLPTAEPHRW